MSLQIKSQAPKRGRKGKISRIEMRRPVKFLSANVTIGLFRLQEIMFAERADRNDKGRFGDKHDGSRDEAREIRRVCGKPQEFVGRFTQAEADLFKTAKRRIGVPAEDISELPGTEVA